MKPPCTVSLIAAALAVSACSRDGKSTLAPDVSGVVAADPAALVQALARAPTVRDRFEIGAEYIPGFAGAYYDASGGIVLRVSPAGDPALAKSAFMAAAGLGGLDELNVRVASADYDFGTLARWYRALRSVLGDPAFVAGDIDESRNRIVIDVDNSAAESRIRQQADAAGIPPGAIEVRLGTRDTPLQALNDRVRPVKGGLRIERSGFGCTLGANAQRSGKVGFITNSHCTATKGAVDGSVFFQNKSSHPGDRIGVETVDPPFFTGGACPAGKQCRYSDAAFAEYDAGEAPAWYEVNRIARTLSPNGSKTIDTNNPYFTVWTSPACTGLACPPLMGSTLDQMGSSTGWRQGTVTSTCSDRGVVGSPNQIMLCQLRTDITATSAGDSGSPVFRPWGSPPNVELMGLAWGSNEDGTSVSMTIFIKSEIGGGLCFAFLCF